MEALDVIALQLPSPIHLDDNLALIKMHGSTHNILVDERVDYRLSSEYRQSFRELVTDAPLLLLMGCSGGDRRLRDLITSVIAKSNLTRVIWIHRAERDDTPSLQDLNLSNDTDPTKQPIWRYPTCDLGQTLRAIYTGITDRLPEARLTYRVQTIPPNLREDTGTLQKTSSDFSLVACPFKLIAPLEISSTPKYLGRRLLSQVSLIPLAYSRLWIDLEEHYSFTQIIAEILEQMRRADTLLSPYVASWRIDVQEDEKKDRIKEIADETACRVHRAMQRARYALIITGLDSFPWQPTAHHGFTNSTSQDANDQSELLREFILHLIGYIGSDRDETIDSKWQNGDSILIVHSEAPYRRHRPDVTHNASEIDSREHGENTFRTYCQHFYAYLNLLNTFSSPHIDAPLDPRAPRENEKLSGTIAFYPGGVGTEKAFIRSLGIALITCHRRTRSAIGLKMLFKDLMSGAKKGVPRGITEEMDRAFNWKDGLPSFFDDDSYWGRRKSEFSDDKNPPKFIRASESGVWCDRPWRDAIYASNTRFTLAGPELACQAATGSLSLDTLRTGLSSALTQLLVFSALHDLIARNYYLRLYLPSRDGFMFLEYAYHRVSSLRYLRVLAITCATLEAAAKDIVSSVTQDLCCGFLAQFCSVLSDSFGDDWSHAFAVLEAANTASENESVSTFGNLRTAINVIRERCLRGFAETWRRSERELRATLPAEELSQWCSSLVQVDLLPSGDASKVTIADDSEQMMKQLRYTLLAVGDTWAKVAYASADFTAFRERRDVIRKHAYASSSTNDDAILAIHTELDMRVSNYWEWYATKPASIHSTFADIPIEQRSRPSKGTEAYFRDKYLNAEISLSKYSVVGLPPLFEAFTLEQRRDAIKDLTELEHDVESAIEDAREEYTLADEDGLRSPILEATAHRGLFVPYRALFLILLGRTRMHLGYLNLDASGELVFRDAFRDFAYARSGIGDENAIVNAMSLLCSAELCLTQVAVTYAMAPIKTEDCMQFIGACRTKLRSAAGYLVRCMSELLRGPRYVLVWRFFHIIESQLQLESVFLDTLELRASGKSIGDERMRIRAAGSLIDRSRKALRAIRACLDETTMKDIRFRDHLRFQWGRLASVCLFSGAVQYWNDTMLQSVFGHVGRYWHELNQSEGIVWLEGGEVVNEVEAAELYSRLRKDEDIVRHVSKFEETVKNMTDVVRVRKWLFSQATHDLLQISKAEEVQIK